MRHDCWKVGGFEDSVCSERKSLVDGYLDGEADNGQEGREGCLTSGFAAGWSLDLSVVRVELS